MARRCEITGKGVMSGNNVSHANNKTRRKFLPNIQECRVYSESLQRFFSLKITTAGLRTIEHKGGLDAFLLDKTPSKLSAELRRIRTQVEAAQAVKA